MDCKWHECNEKNVEDIFAHIKTHLQTQTVYRCMWTGCPKYNEQNVSKGAMYSHCKTHGGVKSCYCKICDTEFSSISVYYRHKKKHSVYEQREESAIQKISALSNLLNYHKQHTKKLVRDIENKKTGNKFMNDEISEIIKKYMRGGNCYTNVKSWTEYL